MRSAVDIWRAAGLASALLPTAWLAPAAAHNGFGVAPLFTEPMGLVVLDGSTPLVLRWTARESHPEETYRLRYQAADFPPTPSPPSALRQGLDLTSLPADRLTYEVPLDLSAVPSGAWRVVAEYDSPPFCVELESAPALIVIRRDGDPPPFGVLVTEPLADSPIVDAEATLALRAIGPAPITVTVEAGDIIPDPDFPPDTLCVEFTWTPTRAVLGPIALEPDPEAGPDRWKLDATWDTRLVPDGAYLFRVTATDTAGNTSTTWARRWVNVEHAEPIPEGPAEPGPERPAEVAEVVEPGPAATDGCSGGRSSAWWAALLATLALAPRRAQTLASSRTR